MIMTDQNTTVAAPATARGAGAISIIRLSGPGSLAILKKIFRPEGASKPWEPRLMRLGGFYDTATGGLIDKGLAVWFPGPNSFTGEDSVEIQGHGGTVVTALLLKAVLKAGASLAAPGEFTRRAFENGRMDLAQAEAVAELVAARSEAESFLAARQLAGGLSERVEVLHKILLGALAELEGSIDFGENTADLDLKALKNRLHREALEPLEKLLADGHLGRPFRDGVRLALVGAPNVGKSSLFNALLGTPRALVSPLAGTTRDYITEDDFWGELRVELADTAGLSTAPRDELDARGQELARGQVQLADLVLWVRDASGAVAVDEAELEGLLPPDRTLMVWNKADLAVAPLKSVGLSVSALTGQGLIELKKTILSQVTGQDEPIPPEVVPNLRHQRALTRTAEALKDTIGAMDMGQPPDICALELKAVLKILEEIRGQTTTEELLQEIFSRFCLGK